MSKKFKSQASSSRAATGALGGSLGSFGGFSAALEHSSSSLSYIAEPPDLTKISEPKLVVPFKNLLKKDSTTKARALEDLQVYLSSVDDDEGLLEDSLLEAWTKLYPRASIDTSRRVRQLAHTLQGTFATSFGKRIARYVPKVIGAWLAGLYDNDKLVLKAARDSFIRVFTTDEKRKNVWKVYQSSILEFVEDAVLQQTSLTLSDERTVNPDEAESKHARVVATATLVLNKLLDTFSSKDTSKQNLDSAQILLSNKTLWSFSHHTDPFVRRSIYNLLRKALAMDGQLLDWKVISVSLISKTLPVDQTGSSPDFSGALLDLTQKRPQIWTDDYSGKTSAYKRLCQYLRKGSQSGIPIYWQNIYHILRALPIEVLSGNSKGQEGKSVSLQSANSLMETFREGILSKDEHRGNLASAWTSFVQTSLWLLDLLPDRDTRQQFLESQITPLLEKYVVGSPAQYQWALPTQSALHICADCIVELSKRPEEDMVQPQWLKLSESLIESLSSSHESSHDLKSSQDLICTQANHMFSLQAEILMRTDDTEKKASFYKIFEEAMLPLLGNSIEILRSQNGNPYGAAVMIEQAVNKTPRFLSKLEGLGTFLDEDIPKLLLSPSAPWLVSILLHCQDREGFSSGLSKSIDRFLTNAEISNSQSLEKFLSSVDYQSIPEHPQLESLVIQNLNQALQGTRQRWNNISAVIKNPTSRHGMADQILLSVVDSLSSDEVVLEALYGISQLLSHNKTAVGTFRNGPHGSKLLAKLLYLSESPADEVAGLADSLNTKIKKLVTGDEGTKSTVEVIQQNLSNVGDDSLSVDSLVAIAQEALSNAPSGQKMTAAIEVFPSKEQWNQALEPFLKLPPNRSTAITNTLGGAVYLVDGTISEACQQELDSIPRDSNHFTSAFRLTYYVTKVFSDHDTLALLDIKQQEMLSSFLPIATQLIDEDMSIESSNGVAGPITPETLEEGMELVPETRLLINSLLRQPKAAGDLDAIGSWRDILETLDDFSPKTYRLGDVYTKYILATDILESNKPQEPWTDVVKRIRESPSPFWSAYILTAFKDSITFAPAGTKLCNELVADVTGLDPDRKAAEGLRKTVLLNILIRGEDSIVERVPTQRLVFLVKHLIDCLQSGIELPGLASETLKLLTSVLPYIYEIYGSHWTDLLELLISLWSGDLTSDENLPLLHSSLRLFACLRTLASSDSNDDLEDAWKESKMSLSTHLIASLAQFDPSHTLHQPRNITADLLARQISTVDVDCVDDVGSLFPLLPVQIWGVQRAAYDILHRYIPKAQEQISFDHALSKSTVSLPDELLSLLLEAPKIDTFSQASVEDSQWMELRCYLLSWKVVFDHFSSSSLAVKENYATSIKENACLPPLLEFTFNFLKHSIGKPVDASKYDARSFEPNQADTPQREAEWLLVHLYYLCLKFLPNLAKSWWIDSKKRIKGPIESWTQKYISPLIIESSLNNVSEWISAQSLDDEHPLEVKISSKSAELIASIEVDEESPPISLAISLPPAYPLQPALVVGRHRVAVDEKKWRSWLLTIQGVIMFSNGDLVDGLLAFRKNVQGALKGQSECAICYSIISADMQTPNKKCGTCKNTFHSSCLFRWFKSSNSSGCPLCRNNFIYS